MALGSDAYNGQSDSRMYVWDSGSLAWIPYTGGAGGGGSVTVTNLPTNLTGSGNLKVSIEEGSLSTTAAYYAKRVDEASPYTYVGEAAAGTATSSASWRVSRLEASGNDVIILWADGNTNADNIWDNRASLSYS